MNPSAPRQPIRPPVRPALLGQTDPRTLDRLPGAAPRTRKTTFNSAV